MNNLAEEKELEPENYIVGKVEIDDYDRRSPIPIIHRLRRRDQLNNGEDQLTFLMIMNLKKQENIQFCIHSNKI